MVVTMTLGRKVTTPGGLHSVMAVNRARVQKYLYTPTGVAIVRRAGFYGGRESGEPNPSSRVLIYRVDPSTEEITERAGYSEVIVASSIFDGTTGGNDYDAPVVTPFLLGSGEEWLYAMGPSSINSTLVISGQTAQFPYPTYDLVWHQDTVGDTNGNPDWLGAPLSLDRPEMNIWLEVDINEPPDQPTSLTPSGSISDLTPTITSDFSDPNESLTDARAFDKPSKCHVQVRATGTITPLWDHVHTATTTEQTNKAFSFTYAGPALSSGTSYEQRQRHADLAGEYGEWTAWTTFTPVTNGTVDHPTAPAGKVLSLTPGPFEFVWRHLGGLSADRAQIRLKKNGTVIQTTGEMTISTAPDGTISRSWASTGFLNLEEGQTYSFDARARDTLGVWSPYSSDRSFFTNSPPNTPTELVPSQSSSPIVTSLPLLTMAGSDPDDPNASLTPTFEVTRADSSFVTRTGSWDATLGKYKYQTTSTDLPSFQTFGWRGRLSDGISATQNWSGMQTVQYVAGPTTTISAPTNNQVLTSGALLVNWADVANQIEYRVRIWPGEPGEGSPTYDSLTQTSAVSQHQLPVGAYHNGNAYTLQLDLKNNALATATYFVPFSVSYTPPTALDPVTFSAVKIGLDSVPSGVTVEWPPLEGFAPEDFRGYRVWRREMGQSFEDAILLFNGTRIGQSRFTDERPRSGVDHIYSFAYAVEISGDDVESAIVEETIRIDLRSVVLTAVLGGQTYRAELLADTSREYSLQTDRVKRIPAGGSKGRSSASDYRSWDISGTFRVISDERASALTRIEQLRALVLQGGTVCYRDERRRIEFVTIDSYKERDLRIQKYEVDLLFSNEQFTEGVRLD